ncbi:MAG: YjgP/YjgQ family permease [Roseivirga sp.]|nr:YjgP/YjgQ family permease [Roseivirga sp.]
MKLLDRYILRKFLITFFFVVLIMVSVVLIITYSERNGSFIENNLTTAQIIGYFLNYSPYVANVITPITVYIAATFVTSRLASHTEIVAILSSGISYTRFLRPFLLGAVVIALISFFLTGWVIPDANKSRILFEANYFNTGSKKSEKNVHIKVAPTRYAYVNVFNIKRKTGRGFTLEEIEDEVLRWKLAAENIQWDSVELVWRLKGWSLRTINGFNESYVYEPNKDTVLHLNMTPDDFSSTKNMQETLNLDELGQHISDLELKGADHIPIFEIERLVRFMSPFTALILTFIGVTLSSKKTRGGVGFQLALGFLLAFIFIILFMTTRSIALAGVENAVLVIWLPNIIFTVLALMIYRLVPK